MHKQAVHFKIKNIIRFLQGLCKKTNQQSLFLL